MKQGGTIQRVNEDSGYVGAATVGSRLTERGEEGLSSITFIIPVSNEDVYRECFLSSPLFKRRTDFQILPQRGFKTSGEAFNDGIDRAVNERIVCLHQDVILPATWAERFCARLKELELRETQIGVVGCIGAAATTGQRVGRVYHRDREAASKSLPAPVETLDELLISFRKSSGLRFDPSLPSFFGYAIDMCMEARSHGLQSFAVDSPVVHQTVDRILPAILPPIFYQSCDYLNLKWRRYLPIQSLSVTLEGTWSLRVGRIKSLILHKIGYAPPPWWEGLPQVDLDAVLSE